jgi:hypothetical protein
LIRGKAICPVTDGSDVSLRKLSASCAGTACSQIISVRKRLFSLGGAERRIGSLFFAPQGKFFAAALLFDVEGSLLAFEVSDAAQFFHAGTVAFSLGASATAKHGEEVGAAGGSHARAKFGKPLQRLVLHVSCCAIAKYVEERFGHGLLPGLGGHVAFKADKAAFCKKALEEI